jgi:hypothetical protein
MKGIDDRELDIVHFSPVCLPCKHFIFDENDVCKHVCKAFPDGIPDEIWRGDNDHKKPYPGDHGIQYEPIDPNP